MTNGGLWCSPVAKTSKPASSALTAAATIDLSRSCSVRVRPVAGSAERSGLGVFQREVIGFRIEDQVRQRVPPPGDRPPFSFHDLVPADPPSDGRRFVHGVQDPAVVRVVLGFVSGDVFVEQGAQSAHLIPLGNESIPCSARLRRRIESGPPKCKRGGSPSGR